MLGVIVLLEDHLRPSFSLLAEATRFLAKMSWYWVEFMMPLTLTRAPGPVEAKQPHNIKDPPPYFTAGMRFFSAHASFFRRQTHRWCAWPKSSIFVSSDHSTWFQSKCQCRLANSRRLRLLVALNKGFFSGNPSK